MSQEHVDPPDGASKDTAEEHEHWFGAPIEQLQRARRNSSATNSTLPTPETGRTSLPVERNHFRSEVLFAVEQRQLGETWLCDGQPSASEPLPRDHAGGLHLGQPAVLEPGLDVKQVAEMLATSAPPTPDHLAGNESPLDARPTPTQRGSSQRSLRQQLFAPTAVRPDL